MTVVPKLDVDRQQLDLVTIEARLAAATPGMWQWIRHGDFSPWWTLETEDNVGILDDGSACAEYNQEIDPEGPDADLIAHAPADLRALVDEVKRLRCEVDERKG